MRKAWIACSCCMSFLLSASLGAADSGQDTQLDKLPDAAQLWSANGGGGAPSFVKHIVPLFNKAGCSARECHGAFQGQNGFRLSLFGYDPALDFSELTEQGDSGPRINRDAPDQSLLLRKPLEQIAHDGGQRFAPGSWQHHMLRRWIASSAAFDPSVSPYLDQLNVLPAKSRLRVGQSVQLRVVAHFNDGTSEEVTCLTTFTSGNTSVATVSPDGSVSTTGLGDTAIVASYAGGVVTSQVLVPRASDGPPPSFASNSPADRFVQRKLRQLNIHPSELCTDTAFLRRVYLDVIGTLPTPVEVRRFLDDERPSKRSQLIDQLLQRPEYAVYWATIFSDWTGNNTSNINKWFKTVWLWNMWLRDKLSRNIPYDQLVGGIVTATSREGRPLPQYLQEIEQVSAQTAEKDQFDTSTYARRRTLDLYWLKRMPDPEKGIAIRTANAFLGVQIQCAECHKHPFDRWTQDDFEGFVSFFRTVRVSNLDGTPFSAGSRDYDKIAVYSGIDPRFARAVREHPPKILAGPVVRCSKEDQDPRVALWDWMRAPDNKFFAHNIVNRLWHHYFGVGIVDPVDDFNAANPPSNPELLDWLAQDFIEHQFNLKHLHRQILNTRAYQLSHVPNATNRTDRRNFSHAQVRRMPAEVAIDALATVTGTRLDFKSYAAPPGTRAIGLAAPTRYGATEYVMDVFGRPKREQTCACERSSEASLAQALFLINDADIHARIAHPEGRLAQLLERLPDDRQLTEELYLTCLSRFPTDKEWQTMSRYIEQADTRAEAMQDILWSLINVREFLFVQ